MTTATRALSIAPDFSLPVDAVTEAIAILAVRNAGKTNTAVVMAEEMLKARLQIVVLDPVGPWWGLRAAADGVSPGLPILVMGGEHGDLPLEVRNAETIAEFLSTEPVPAVLDLSGFTKGEQTEFVSAFADKLWHVKAKERYRTPMMLILEESDEFAPQKPQGKEAIMLGRIERLAKLGRNRGIGITLITQRSASLNKNVLSQVSMLVLMRTVSPQDRKAVMEWVVGKQVEDEARQVMDDLPSLPTGSAWVWSPGWLQLLKRVQIRRRETFDSSATPKVGERRAEPKQLADVDIEAFRSKLGQVIEQARADDPRELRRRIGELERQLREQKPAAAEKIVERVEVPVLEPLQFAGLVEEAGRMAQVGDRLQETGDRLMTKAEEILAALKQISDRSLAGEPKPAAPISLDGRRAVRVGHPKASVVKTAEQYSENDSAEIPASLPGGFPPSDVKLLAGERRMLAAVARFPSQALTREQLALLTGFTASGGGYQNYVRNLKRQALLRESDGLLELTDAGRAHVGSVGQPQTTDELVSMWAESLLAGERRMLDELVQRYPEGCSRAELADLTGFEATGGGYQNYVRHLKRVGVVVEEHGELRASPTLFLEGE